MNRKGFTLIELLATIVILAVIGGIATYGVIGFINTSKLKSEKIFVDKLSNLIDDYLDLYPPTINTGTSYYFDKCIDDSCNDNYSATATKMLKSDGNPITINDLINPEDDPEVEGIVTYKDLVNPKNKSECFDNSTNPEIVVYKDNDYVYHYYVDLSSTNTKCDITYENALINNMPKNLTKVLNNNGVTLPQILKDTIS